MTEVQKREITLFLAMLAFYFFAMGLNSLYNSGFVDFWIGLDDIFETVGLILYLKVFGKRVWRGWSLLIMIFLIVTGPVMLINAVIFPQGTINGPFWALH